MVYQLRGGVCAPDSDFQHDTHVHTGGLLLPRWLLSDLPRDHFLPGYVPDL